MAKGDHIKVRRCGGLYTHHGIDIGDGTVVHFSGELFQQKGACVCRVPFEEFTRGEEAQTVDYAEETRTPAAVVKAALALEGDEGYDLWSNNCEHFASYCKTGRRHSAQVRRVVHAAAAFATTAVVAGGAVTVALIAKKLDRKRSAKTG